MKYLLSFFALLGLQVLNAQTQSEQMDLITMTNGYQLLGHIVEQRPGIDMKLYRPVENDTITMALDSVEKIAVVRVNRYAEKSVDTKDTLLNIGRFNNKKNIYVFAFIASNVGVYPILPKSVPNTSLYQYNMEPKGGGFSYYRSVHNSFFGGGTVSFQYHSDSKYQSTTSTTSYVDEWSDFQFMLEGKVRLSRRKQNYRFTSLFGLGVGMQRIFATRFLRETFPTVTPSSIYDNYDVKYSERMAIYGNNLMAQASLTFKINPDNNSGFIIEPMLAYTRPKLSTTYADYNNTTDLDVKIVHRVNIFIPTIRIGYFF